MSSPPRHPPTDPTFLHTRREAIAILVLWAVSLAWTIGYCWFFGYGGEAADRPLVLGLPSWVFWGIAVPWAVAAVLSILFALLFMADDDLGEDNVIAEPKDARRDD